MTMNDTPSQQPARSSAIAPDAPVYVAGHRGLVGAAMVRAFTRRGHQNIVTRTHAELDLTDGPAVREFFTATRPQIVIVAAAKVGGILANNTYPAEFIHQNLAIELNCIHEAYRHGVDRLLFLGSSCIYPRLCPQPIKEEYLLTGPLEPTNAPYAVAKIAGIEMCRSYRRQYGCRFRSVMPTNLYGPGDNFDLETSHVLPALIRKFHLAKLVRAGDADGIRHDIERFGPLPADVRTALGIDDSGRPTSEPCVLLWGSGRARREFLHVDDLADACLFLLERDDGHDLVNIGVGRDITIAELARLVAEIVGYDGAIRFDTDKPDGTPRKVLDVSRLTTLGWQARITLRQGITDTYRWYLEQIRG